MPDLPYDICVLIVAHLRDAIRPTRYAPRNQPLATYAGIFRSWNAAIERETFRDLRLRRGTLARTEEILKRCPSRLSAVRRIVFTVRYGRSDSRERDLSGGQLRERDGEFSGDVERLLRFLGEVERRGAGRTEGVDGVKLELWVESEAVRPEVGDGDEESSEEVENDAGDGELFEYGSDYEAYDDYRRRYTPAPLRYVGDGLPKVHCVRDVQVEDSEDAKLWGSSVTTIISAMVGLQGCRLGLHDERTKSRRARIDYRESLGESLSRIPHTCTQFFADFNHTIEDDSISQRAFVPPSLDVLCIGLRNFSMHLVWLSLDHLTISPALFWTQDEERGAAEPYWPKLEEFYVRYPPVNASGEWLVHTSVLSRADLERTNSIYIAVGKAIRNMPALKRMELEMPAIIHITEEDRSFVYKYDEEREAALVEWDSCENLNFPPAVVRAFGITEEELKVGVTGCWATAYVTKGKSWKGKDSKDADY